MCVVDRGPDGTTSARPIAYRDIVILLRSMVYKAEQIAQVLDRHGIPVHRDSGSGYFNSTEVRDMIALLHLLDNAQQDIPLAAVLRSPLSGLAATEDSLARIRLAYRDRSAPIPFHEAAARYAKEQTDELAARLRDFFQGFERWRTIARLRPLADLLRHIYDETGYLAFCGGLDNGEQRCANLLYLHERAKQFGGFSRQGLYRFLRFLEALRNESDVGLPSVLGEAEDVVRIMSVHRAKGLEFPVVFLPDLGKRINLRDSSGHVLVDRASYLGLPAVDEEREVRYPSLASVLVSQRLRQQAMAEELRILYVAATRAKEHLILVGTCDPKSHQRWQALYGSHRGPLPAEAVLAASNMLEWIGPAAAALSGAAPKAFEVTVHTAEELADWTVVAQSSTGLSPEQASYAALKPLEPSSPANQGAQAVIERLSFAYPHEEMTRRPAALAVTEWAKLKKSGPVSAESQFSIDRLLPLPAAVAEKLEMAATEKGTATHLVLEHLDFSRPCIGEDLRGQIDRLLDRRLIAPPQADAVDLAAIEWFVKGEIGALIRRSARQDVIREMPFNLALGDGRPAGALGLDQTMLRGRIDLMIRDGEHFIVVDYKTDDVSAGQIAQREETYRQQVQLYRTAIERLTSGKVNRVCLVFLAPRILHEASATP
jgi:ATP-dependent helicase/nuclease subunit A